MKQSIARIVRHNPRLAS